MTLLWPEGILIEVYSDTTATPQAFVWQEQVHHVYTVTNRWRVDQDWWQRQVWREYFKLTTQTGLLVIIYQDLLNKHWYLQRLYD